jgi:hypothetical protein
MVHVGTGYWYRLFGAGLQFTTRYLIVKCDSGSIILLIFQGSWMGQGQVVVATF